MGGSRRALVTGGFRGIGRGIVETLARDGCDVGVLDYGPAALGEQVRAAVERLDRRGWFRVVDVRDSAKVNESVEALASLWGGIDILVNNAGVVRDQVLWKMTDAEWAEVVDIDLSGVFYGCRAVVPVMRKNGWGAIVNISSINGLRGKFGQSNYAAAKAGVIGLTKSLAKEVARFNITVNAVAPGFVETEIVQSLSAEARAASLSEILLERPGSVQDVAELTAFLCGDRARFITGEVIRVDGGQYI